MPKSSKPWPNVCAGPVPAERSRLWTIGHSNRGFAEFLDLLQAHGIRLVADVRSWPGSRRHPQFGRVALERGLEAVGIAYRHLPGLGGRRGPQALGTPSPNGFWEVPGFRNYADYALTPAFAEALEELIALGRAQPTAILCAEAHPSRCHRRIITDHLLARGIEVVHILDAGRSEPAEMTDAARIAPNGVVTYPPQQPGLFE